MVRRSEIVGTAEILPAGKLRKVIVRKIPIVREQWKLENNKCMRADTLYSLLSWINFAQYSMLDRELNSTTFSVTNFFRICFPAEVLPAIFRQLTIPIDKFNSIEYNISLEKQIWKSEQWKSHSPIRKQKSSVNCSYQLPTNAPWV